jgi:DNA polymerase-3 subunit delta
VESGKPPAVAAKEHRIWGAREKLLPQALARMTSARLADLLARCAEVDRLAKGLRSEQRDSDPWLELADIALDMTRTAAKR